MTDEDETIPTAKQEALMADQIDYDTPVEGMAPPDLHWHRQYAKTFALFGQNVDALRAHPAFQEAEDLGDYVETVSSLLTFRPHTRQDIEKDAYTEVFGPLEVASALAESKYTPDQEEDTE